MSVASKTYRLKVTLRGSRPSIWRRVEVDAGVTLFQLQFQLHRILQVVMGWTAIGRILGLECLAPEEVLEPVTGSKTDDAG
jgi:hypothetical protein